MNDLLMILGVLVGLIGIIALINYLYSSNIINIKLPFSKQLYNAVYIAKLFVNVFPLKDEIKDKSIFMFDVVDDITEFIHYLELDDTDKEALAFETAMEILNKMNISPTDSEKQLMALAINASLEWLKNNKKVSS